MMTPMILPLSQRKSLFFLSVELFRIVPSIASVRVWVCMWVGEWVGEKTEDANQ